jgi:solute:Na+ symporter, SSS family
MIGPDGKSIPALSNAAFPMMVQYLLPRALRGIVVAGLLSALMGSLAGRVQRLLHAVHRGSVSEVEAAASQHQLVRTGRIATA